MKSEEKYVKCPKCDPKCFGENSYCPVCKDIGEIQNPVIEKEIIDLIQNGKSKFIKRISRTKSILVVNYYDEDIFVIYDKKPKVTFLLPDYFEPVVKPRPTEVEANIKRTRELIAKVSSLTNEETDELTNLLASRVLMDIILEDIMANISIGDDIDGVDEP
jgi:hypothetical protein